MSKPIVVLPPRVRFLNERTGDISREWYLLILSIIERLGGANGPDLNEFAVGPLVTTSNLEDALLRLADSIGIDPVAMPYVPAEPSDSVAPPVPDFRPSDELAPVVWVGTLGQQNAEKVAITGGSLDNVVVGATTPNKGSFTELKLNGNLGFYGTAPVAKATVTGSRGANAALLSLINALVGYGLITDTTTV